MAIIVGPVTGLKYIAGKYPNAILLDVDADDVDAWVKAGKMTDNLGEIEKRKPNVYVGMRV